MGFFAHEAVDIDPATGIAYLTEDDGGGAVLPDPAVARLVADYKARISPISERVVGTASEDITRTQNTDGESELGDLIADAQRDFAGTDLAFMNSGGIRADIASGPVTYGDLSPCSPSITRSSGWS